MWQESDENGEIGSRQIRKRSVGQMKDFALYPEHSSKSRMDWQEERVDMRYLLGGFCYAPVDGGSKTGTLELKKSRWDFNDI